MPLTYFISRDEAETLIAAHVPGEKLPRKGRQLLIVRPAPWPTISIEPFIEDNGKRKFKVTQQ